jgi:hypothetical protein
MEGLFSFSQSIIKIEDKDSFVKNYGEKNNI